MDGLLTTHVLDTAQGHPASHMRIELWRVEPASERGEDGETRTLLKTILTNADGRANEPLLAGEECVTGIYELVFLVGDYFAKQAIEMTEPPFLGRVPVRFGLADPAAHYHVPLLVSPWAYSTYRGS